MHDQTNHENLEGGNHLWTDVVGCLTPSPRIIKFSNSFLNQNLLKQLFDLSGFHFGLWEKGQGSHKYLFWSRRDRSPSRGGGQEKKVDAWSLPVFGRSAHWRWCEFRSRVTESYVDFSLRPQFSSALHARVFLVVELVLVVP